MRHWELRGVSQLRHSGWRHSPVHAIPFARAQTVLRELCGWEWDDDAIRQVRTRRPDRPRQLGASVEDDERFEQASGAIEVAIDAGKVNTDTGWRDVKMAVICKRKVGKSTMWEDWAERELSTPSIRTVVAAIEETETFAGRVRRESDRLGVTTASDMTILADGAEWIWNLSEDVVPQATGVLDAFHPIEHIADAVKAVWGADNTPETTQRIASGRLALFGEGKAGIEQWLVHWWNSRQLSVPQTGMHSGSQRKSCQDQSAKIYGGIHTVAQFVLLEHDWPTLHYDLLLQSGEILRAWRLHAVPAPEVSVVAEPNHDHRLQYLEYEGPLSGGRGSVRRIDTGRMDWIVEDAQSVVVRLEGQRLAGELVLAPDVMGRLMATLLRITGAT